MSECRSSYGFEADGSFTIRNYNMASPFASFLPGIAGPWGIPMWAFYVNRGQGICSFGLRDKDHPIAEFVSANWAFQLVFRQGFQTFLKISDSGGERHHEPFQVAANGRPAPQQTMEIRPGELTLRDSDPDAGVEVEVRYFTLPQESLGALVRSVRVRNLSDKPVSVQMLDGLALIIPHGLNNFSIKEMRYIAQSHAEVIGLAERTPGFRTKATSDDSTVVETVSGVNFCFGYEGGAPDRLLQPIVDPAAVYGSSTDLSRPVLFLDPGPYRAPGDQMTENQLPCGLLLAGYELKPLAEKTFHMFYGYAPSPAPLAEFVSRARDESYVDQALRQNRALVEKLTQPCAMVSSHATLDAYARQNVLDNVMRGGSPTTLGRSKDGKPIVLSLYTRKHGDLERDYNYYIIEPTFFSQGESNYRDVNQNRRHDVFMNPDVGASDIVFFMNLIQPDGFNPMLVQPKKLICKDTPALRTAARKMAGRQTGWFLKHVTKEFELGRLLTDMTARGMAAGRREELVAEILHHAEPVEASLHGHGFWTDHWTYNMDLLESFRGIFPERVNDLLFRRREFTYCDSHVFVKPRSRKYVLLKGVPCQLNSLYADPDKEALIRTRPTRPYAVRTRQGRGKVYATTLASKLLGLAAVKLASLDFCGMGIEMEADRPNWYDALNGLPGCFGSSISETFELKRLILLLRETIETAPRNFAWTLPVECGDLVSGLHRLLRARNGGDRRRRAFRFWDAASALKEKYRSRVWMGFSGKEKKISAASVRDFLERALARVESGIAAARDRKTGLYHTYFRYEIARWKPGPVVDGHPTFTPLAVRQIRLPLFLEGQVHALRLEKNSRKAAELVRAVRRSSLFDRTLSMYKVNGDVSREPISIGRTRTFARGWLENESVWLHMEYKYLLEMLRGGLPQEFFEDFRHCAIPFLDPQVYGRSTTENSSFLVSDVYPDRRQVGKGFMARLSGATAEFIHMWICMCAGERPFRTGKSGALEAVLQPTLPSWLFTSEARRMDLAGPDGKPVSYEVPRCSFAFVFLSHTVVIYTQDGPCRNTFGPAGAAIRSMRVTFNDGRVEEFRGAVIPAPHAEALRNRQVRLIEARLG